FLIMGEGSYETHIRKRARELGLESRVSIRGWGTTHDVAAFLCSLDASILLSRTTLRWNEHFGRVLVESQSCGVPVIGSSSGSIPDVVGNGGWITPEYDAESLAKLLDHIAGHREEIEVRREAGRKNVASRFTYEATAQQLAVGWRDALSRRSVQTGHGRQ